MKRVKRVLALLAALALVLAMAVPAFADEAKYTISTDQANHTYEVYQIFTGDLSERTLSNVKWGRNSKNNEGANVGAAVLATIEGLKGETDAKIWNGIEQYVNFETTPFVEVTSTTPASVPAGYYVIKDKDGSQDGKQDAYTNYIVQVAGNVKIKPKSSVPTVKKEVKDINDSTETALGEWQKDADHDFNDKVCFRLTGTLPENYATYTTYEYIFHDTMSKGLTFDPSSVEIYLGDEETGTKIDVSKYTVSTQSGANDGTEITIKFADLKTAVNATSDNKITVVYKATLNEQSVIGSAGNPNKVYLEFSNNPNGEGTGKTPEDTVIVFTYKVAANKVDGNDEKLAGAGFKLSKFDKESDSWKLVGYQNVKLDARGNPVETNGRYEVANATDTSFAWNRIDDGKYKLEEVVTPAGYNTIDPVEFDVVAGHANLTLSSLS